MNTLSSQSLERLESSLSGLDTLGKTDEGRRNRSMVIDYAWNKSNDSVSVCAQNLGVSYPQAMAMLTHPVINRLNPKDPRVVVFHQVLQDQNINANAIPPGPIPTEKTVLDESKAVELAKKGFAEGSTMLLENLVREGLTPPAPTKTQEATKPRQNPSR